MRRAAHTVVRGSLERDGRASIDHDPIAGTTKDSRLQHTGIGALLVVAACLGPLVGIGALSASALLREGAVGAVGFGIIGIAVASRRRSGRKNPART